MCENSTEICPEEYTDMEYKRAESVKEVRAARAKERRLAALRRLSGKKTQARKVVTEGRNTESLKGPEQNQSFKYSAPQTCDSENEDEEHIEISKIDWVTEWLDKHCFFDEQAWGAVMAGVEATPEEMENELQDKPNPPVGNFKLDSSEYTSLDNTCPKKFLAALTRLNHLQKSHDDILAQLTFPNKMVVQHVTYIVKAFLRRMYFRMKGKSHKKQEAVMRKMHYAMQGIVHRYFKRGMDKKVYLHKAAEKDEFENWSDDEDDEEGRGDDDQMEEGNVNETKDEQCDEVQENEENRSNNEDEIQKCKTAIEEIKMAKKFVSSAVTLHAQAPETLLNTMEAIYNGKVTVEHVLKHPQTLTHQNDRVEGSVPGMKGQDGNSSNEEDDEDEYYIPDDKSHASLEFSDDERMHCHLSDVEDDECETNDASWDEEDDSDAESEARLSPTEYPSDGEESSSVEDGECGGASDDNITKKSQTSPEKEVDFKLLNRLAGEFSDGSEEEGHEKAAWRRSQDVSRTLWMQEMVSDCPLKDKTYSQEFHCCRAPLFPKVNLSTHSIQEKEKILEQFMEKNVSRNIRRYVMKTVCRRNFAIFKKLWRRAKGLKRFPGLRLGTQGTAAWQSFKRQKAYLNDFLMTEKEALLYSLSRKHKVSCEEIFQAQATVEMLRKKRRLAVKIVKFLDQLPIRRLQYLNEHVLAKAQRGNGWEPQSHSDMTSVLLFLQTVATMQGHESPFPCHGPVCEKLQGYVESLVHDIDDEYKFFCKEKGNQARREEVKVKLNNMSRNKLEKYLSVAKETYQSLTRKFLQQKHKYLKRRLSEHELNSLFPLCPKDDIGLMHIPKHQRLLLLTQHNNKQLKLRRDYINMVKEKARHTKTVLAKMNRFLSRSSAQDIILKVYDIQTQESEWAQRSKVLEDEAISYLEVSPQEYKESTKDSLTGLTWDIWSDDEQDSDSDWMDEGSEEGEGEMRKEEEMERKADYTENEPLTIQKIFRELHVQYYPTGNYILKNQQDVQESYPTSFPFEQKPWETPVHHAILDRFVTYLSNNKSQNGRPLKIDFRKEIRRLWHYKPKGFIKTIRCYENLSKTYNKEHKKTLRAWTVTKADEDHEHLKHHEFKVSSECEGETQATPTKEKEKIISMKRKFQVNEDITHQFLNAESKKIKLDHDEHETKEMDTGKKIKRKIEENEQITQINKKIKNGGYDKTINTKCTSAEDEEQKKSVKRRFQEEWDVMEHPKDNLKEVQNKKKRVWREESHEF
ncbi:uncharacterized protein LOC135099162 [Scylla paramamosain]|uniref:uncharacterized protein LOC135099162 n=1 Tax=Scylla paramamosain TaxID=85552 RepID=UPI003083B24E